MERLVPGIAAAVAALVALFFALGGVPAIFGTNKLSQTVNELTQLQSTLATNAQFQGGFGTGVIAAASLVQMKAVPPSAVVGTTMQNQWKGQFVVTGNTQTFFADLDNIPQSDCLNLVQRIPPSGIFTSVAGAAAISGLPGATAQTLPIGLTNASTVCANATNALRFNINS